MGMRYRAWLLTLPIAWCLLPFIACSPVTNQPGDGSNAAGRDAGEEKPVRIEKLPSPAPVEGESKRRDLLRERIESAIEHVGKRTLTTKFSSWTIFHGILGVGPELKLHDPESKKSVDALDFILDQPEKVDGLLFLDERPWGLDVRLGPPGRGQGHQDQYVAEIAQWGMPLDRSVTVPTFDGDGKVSRRAKLKFKDLVEYSKARASTTRDQELSWTIMVLSHYYGTDFEWKNRYGEKLKFVDLVKAELNAPIAEAACGGTHRLFGLTWAYHVHRENGGRDEGTWKDVAAKIKKYKQMAREHQNPDGTFSTQYVSRAENEGNAERRINTTGHVLEWLALSLTDEELKKYWVQDAANALALLILARKDSPLESGSLYHAAHALQMYHARVYGKHSGDTGAKPKIPLPPTS